jgi:hypothetical protein
VCASNRRVVTCRTAIPHPSPPTPSRRCPRSARLIPNLGGLAASSQRDEPTVMIFDRSTETESSGSARKNETMTLITVQERLLPSGLDPDDVLPDLLRPRQRSRWSPHPRRMWAQEAAAAVAANRVRLWAIRSRTEQPLPRRLRSAGRTRQQAVSRMHSHAAMGVAGEPELWTTCRAPSGL